MPASRICMNTWKIRMQTRPGWSLSSIFVNRSTKCSRKASFLPRKRRSAMKRWRKIRHLLSILLTSSLICPSRAKHRWRGRRLWPVQLQERRSWPRINSYRWKLTDWNSSKSRALVQQKCCNLLRIIKSSRTRLHQRESQQETVKCNMKVPLSSRNPNQNWNRVSRWESLTLLVTYLICPLILQMEDKSQAIIPKLNLAVCTIPRNREQLQAREEATSEPKDPVNNQVEKD